MGVMSKITIRQMLLNKRRTTITIIGVIIAVAMFTAVSTLLGSFMDFGQQAAIANRGNYHVCYYDLSSEDLNTIQADDNVKSSYAIHDEGLAQLPDGYGSKKFLWIKAISANTMEDSGVHLVEGRLPQNDQELVLSESIKQRNPDGYTIGQTVTFDLGERKIKNPPEGVTPELDGSITYMGEDETFKVLEQKTYTIVGFATMASQEQSYMPSLTAVTALNTDVLYRGTLDVYVQAKHIDSIYAWGDDLGNKIGEKDGISYDFNNGLLMFEGINQDSQFMGMLFTLIAILFIIIFIGAIALIYNAFAISITERSTDFGLLSSIGATKRQKRRSVLLEALLILAVAVPIGVLGGYFGLWLVFAAVNPAINTLVSGGYLLGSDLEAQLQLRVVISPIAILIAVIMSVLTVLVSAWIPAVRAGRVTPIEAIRQAKDVKLTPRSVKTSRLTGVLFGIEGEIAAKNMKRSKKRSRVVIVSFVISLVLFLSASSFTHLFSQSVDVATGDVNYNIYVNLWQSANDASKSELPKELLQAENAISHLDGIEDFTVVNGMQSFYPKDFKEDILSASARKIWDAQAEKGNNLNQPVIQVVALNDETLKAYCDKVGADYDTMQNTENFNGILVNNIAWKEGKNYTSISVLDKKMGDTQVLTGYTHEESDEEATDSGETDQSERKVEHDRTFRIAATTDQVPIGFSTIRSVNDGGLGVDVFVSQAVFEKYLPSDYYYNVVYLSAADSGSLSDQIEELMTDPAYRDLAYSVSDITSQVRMIEQIIFLINTFSYVFIALISAIGIANIFNTISTGIILRQKEFAMLKSVGMSPKGFHKMLFFESLLYGIKSLLWGLPISFVVMALLYLVLRQNFAIPFSVPWLQVAIGICAIFVIVLITVCYGAVKIRKKNVIEGLRKQTL